uniref:30S ribosomal protein S6 n=1 Tax=Bdellovibrio bacteriovorus TaxID=959 RepID=UPI00403D913B
MKIKKELFKKNKATIESYKGSVNSLETWGKRTLATPIGKLKKKLSTSTEHSKQILKLLLSLKELCVSTTKFFALCTLVLTSVFHWQNSWKASKKGLSESAAREKEREAKMAARKAAFAAAKAERSERFDKGE